MYLVEDEGVLEGVGVMVGFIDEESLFHGIIQEGETTHDGNNEFPDAGTGVGLIHDGTYGFGVGVGRVVGYSIDMVKLAEVSGVPCSGGVWPL